MASLPKHIKTCGSAGTNFCSPRAPSAASSRQQGPTSSGSGAAQASAQAVAVARRGRLRAACAAFAEQHQSDAHGTDSRGHGGGNGSGSETGSLRERLAAAATAEQLHQLLLRHAGELQGPEVATALEAAVKRRLLSGPEAAAAGTGELGGAALAQLLVRLAAAHSPGMAPSSLAASAWSLGVLQLPGARPVLRSMHAAANAQPTQFQPSQLCALLWASSVLDPAFHSPLFLALAGLLDQGMSLALFAPADLAMLGWLCGREGGTVARDVLLRVTDECRLKLEAYRALQAEVAGKEGSSSRSKGATAQLPGVNWVHDTPLGDVGAALGVKMRAAAWKRMVSAVKGELACATNGEVLAELELRLCSRPGLNPLVVPLTDDGRALDRPLESFASFKHSHKLVFRIIPRMRSLYQASAGGQQPGGQQPGGGGGSSQLGDATAGASEDAAATLSADEAAEVLRQSKFAAKFWEALAAPSTRAAALAGPDSFSAAATLASGRRLLLTWRRQGTTLLPVETTQLPPMDPGAAAAAAARWATGAAGQATPTEPPRRRAAPLPPPPFGPPQAALLLSGLAAMQLRVGGVVEPLLQQCQPALRRASADDVSRIVIALGELQMEPTAETFRGLLDRLSTARADLSPRQAVSALWAVARIGYRQTRVAYIGAQHLRDHLQQYEAVDVIGMLWACAQLNGAVPDSTLAAALRRLSPDQLQRCSTSALCNLVWAVGRLAAVKTEPGARLPSGDARWLGSKAGAAVLSVAAAALDQLAGRAWGFAPHEAAAAAVALAAHAPHAAALPQAPVAALRSAAAAAAASDALGAVDLSSLSVSAARLRWADPRLLDALAAALHARAGVLLRPGDVARAMAALAPAAYPALFAALAAAHVAMLRHSTLKEVPTSSADELQERAAELAAFAAVAQVQGLPRKTLLDLVGTVQPRHLRSMPLTGAVAALELAAAAGLDREAPLVRACCAAIRDAVDDMSADELRQTWSVLRRLRRYDPALVAVMDACLAKLPAEREPPQLVEGLAPAAPQQPPF